MFKTCVNDGTPWIDYKEADKPNFEQFFVFHIENFLSFVLREICITYPCVAVSGNAQLPMKVSVQLSSTTHQFSPVNIPVNLISSPSENYTLGVLDEEAQGQRKQPLTINYPCNKGDTITVIVSGDPVRLTVGCMIVGRKRGVISWR